MSENFEDFSKTSPVINNTLSLKITREKLSPIPTIWEATTPFESRFKDVAGENLKTVLAVYNNGKTAYYLDEKNLNDIGTKFLNRLDDEDYFPKIKKHILSTCDELKSYVPKLKKRNLKNICSEELNQIFIEFQKKYVDMILFGTISFYAQSEIEKKLISFITSKNAPPEAMEILTFSYEKSWPMKEKDALIKLAKKLSLDSNFIDLFKKSPVEIDEQLVNYPSIESEINNHVEGFCWVPYEYEGPAWDRLHFISELKNLNKNYDSEMYSQSVVDYKIKKKSLDEELKVDNKTRSLFDVMSEMIFLKEYRNGIRSYANYCFEEFLKEIARRIGLSLPKVRYIFPDELSNAILNEKFDKSLIEKRMRYSIYFRDNDIVTKLTGKEAKDFVKKNIVAQNFSEFKELKGTVAMHGNVKGIVKIINNVSASNKFNEGDILVTGMTTPDFVPLMRKSSAIITDEGGITCHAAIVAREMNKPCIIGTKVGTTFLKDGDFVEMNGKTGTIRKLMEQKK